MATLLQVPVKTDANNKLCVVSVGGSTSAGTAGPARPLPQLPVKLDSNGYLCVRIVG
jgi:hypothetical protein